MPETEFGIEEIRIRREFEHCDHTWHENVPILDPRSMCHKCRQPEKVQANNKFLRQFFCCNHYWYAWVPDDAPYSPCRECEEEKVEAIPKGSERGVGLCTFQCSCKHVYVVRCRMMDTAKCYACRDRGLEVINSPIHFAPCRRRSGRRKSSNTHGCSRCNYGSTIPCPNLKKLEEKDANKS